LQENSLFNQAYLGVFIKSLCTKVEADSAEKSQADSNSLCETGKGEGEDKVETKENISCTKIIRRVTHERVDNTVLGIQNKQEKSIPLGEKASSSSSFVTDSVETSRVIDSDINNKGLDLPNNTTSYPAVALPRFHLPPDWRQSRVMSPGIKFPGEIYVIKNYTDELEHKDILEHFLQEDVLGFDAEHCPIQHLVCVIQLATQDKAVLWQCMNFKTKIPRYLKEILTGSVAKVSICS
jgi:hypothetical protein